MAVPKKKTTKTKKRMRRSHLALAKTKTVKCKKCGARKRPHIVCKKCGTYKGRSIIDVRTSKEKKADARKKKKAPPKPTKK